MEFGLWVMKSLSPPCFMEESKGLETQSHPMRMAGDGLVVSCLNSIN